MRARLGLSQSAFVRKLHCSSMTLSRWERGLIEPPPDCLIAIGKMAGPPLGLRFWRMAGIDPTAVKRMLVSSKKKRTRGGKAKRR
jgi:transcriptional regulator with XRE-family HTH domain